MQMAILLFNDECAVCRRIGHWVRKSAQNQSGETTLSVQPIGDEPDALRTLNPDLDIWDAYETIHLLMPDGSMRVGGDAVAEVLRSLPNTKWFAGSFAFSIFGFRPFQTILNLSYAVLSDVRPLFGCESCGTPSFWVRPIHRMIKWTKRILRGSRHPNRSPHFTSFSPTTRQAVPGAAEPLVETRRL